MNDLKQASVIITVYNDEKYLNRCIDSVINQTYKDIELIIVNDGSKDKSDTIISDYADKYDNIKCVRHSKRKGKLKALLSGIEEASGEYLAFVNVGGISSDWIRQMINKAVSSNSDMVLGDICGLGNEGAEYYNLDPIRTAELELCGDECFELFMKQKGLFFGFGILENKLIRKSLWNKINDRILKLADSCPDHSLPEGMPAAALLWSEAERVSNIHDAFSFIVNVPDEFSDLRKRTDDLRSAMDFMEKEIKPISEKYSDEFREWRRLEGRKIFDKFAGKTVSYNDYAYITRSFDMKSGGGRNFDDKFFCHKSTALGEAFDWHENIKKFIASPMCGYVSFDVFDTLILRPFFQPSDIFFLMNDYFMEVIGTDLYVNFSEIRTDAEKLCRKRLGSMNSKCEEITLRQIYEQIGEQFGLNNDNINKLMEKELSLELKYCSRRDSGKELYDLARYCGRKILLISDTYLPKEAVEGILRKNGYDDHALYLSSDVLLGKWTGHLFEYVLERLGLKDDPELGNVMCHIGDNWLSDHEIPKKYGISVFNMTSPVELMKNNNPGIYCGNSYKMIFENGNSYYDMSNALWTFMGVRTSLAIAANRFFDYPAIEFNKNSDFNADPRFIGYYALGTHILAVCRWLADSCENADTIHFAARDGYIIKQAYDILYGEKEGAPKSNYLYISRKSLAAVDLKSVSDIYSFISKLNIRNYSPSSMLELLRPCFGGDNCEKVLREMKEELKAGFEIKFGSDLQFELFVKSLSEKYSDCFDFESLRKKSREYFSEIISENDVIFDVGYSGRAEAALSELLGYPVNSRYIHSNSEMLDARIRRGGFKTEMFFNYKPPVTGIIREHMLMQNAPSAIGYDYENKTPVFEEHDISYQTGHISSVMQNAALDFIRDISGIFGDDLDKLYFRREDMSAPLEYFLNFSKVTDRSVFASLMFEDEFGEGKSVRALDFWNKCVNGRIASAKNTDPALMKAENISEVSARNSFIAVSRNKPPKPKKTRICFFTDRISAEESDTDNLSKCAGDVSNLAIYDGIEKTVYPEVVNNWFTTHEGGFGSDDFDVYITANLNCVKENQDLTYLKYLLDKLGDRPLFPLAIGLSCEKEKSDFGFEPQSLKILSEIAERCKSVGVRGEYTAEILSDNGIKNTVVIGCPSVYRCSEKIKRGAEINRAAGSFRIFRGKERELVRYFTENDIKLFGTKPAEIREGGRLFFDIDLWRNELKKTDFVIGMNFHNGVVSLQAGTPALFVNYETGGREMCGYFGLPCIDIDDFDPSVPVTEYCNLADYSEFEKISDNRRRAYSDFLKDNGIFTDGGGNRVIDK